jgi:hypothetical protein
MNSDWFAPVTDIEFIIRFTLPSLLIITVLGVDVLPTRPEPKLTDIGLTDIIGPGVTLLEGADAGPVPIALVAVTLKV